MQITDAAFNFKLKGVDGEIYTLESFKDKKALALIFSCNHCPYVRAYEERMNALEKEYGPKGFQLVAINSNDDDTHPEDSYDNMVIRARNKKLLFTYLRDDKQEIARAFGATRTPHVFLFDAKRHLRYMGAIDDNWEYPNKVKEKYLAMAIESVLEGKPLSQKETFPVGCGIKWKKV